MEHTYRMRIFHDKLMDTDLYFLVDNEMPTTEEGKREGGVKKKKGGDCNFFYARRFHSKREGPLAAAATENRPKRHTHTHTDTEFLKQE